LKIKANDNINSLSRPAYSELGYVQINRLVRKNLSLMMILLVIAVAVFLYMVYVLIKPEKF